MRLVTRKRLRAYARKRPRTRASLARWEGVVSAARWTTPAEVQQTFGDVDRVTVHSHRHRGNTVYVFRIQGNAHRLLTALHFRRQIVYVLRLLTHAEYDRRPWIREP